MKNCVVTKFLKTVSDDSLPIVGYEKYRVNLTSSNEGGTLKFNKEEKVILLDATWTANGTREIIVSANTAFYPNSSNITPDTVGQQYCTILVPKYSFYYFGRFYPLVGKDSIDVTAFKYGSADNAEDVTLSIKEDIRVYGLNYVPWNKVRIVELGGIVFEDDVDLTPLGADGKLTKMRLGNTGMNGKVHGVLDNLGKSNVTWDNGTYLPNTKNVSIDLVNFVNNRRNAGATTGTITFRYLGTITVKANGVVLDVPAQSTNVIEWTADSITLDGTPIG